MRLNPINILKYGAGGALAIVGGMVMLLIYGLGLLIHVITILIALSMGGIIAAMLSLSTPFLAEIFWVIYMWRKTGIFLNTYTLLILAYISLIAIVVIVAIAITLISSLVSKKTESTKT